MSQQKGLFIVFEGGDGSSKTTQSTLYKEWLAQQNIPYIGIREPDGIMREIVLDPSNEGKLHPYADALIFATSRINNYKMVVEPALAEGKIVVCDRYLESSMAYQGHAGGIGMDKIKKIHDTFIEDNRITILLQVPIEVSRARARKRDNEAGDRMEQRVDDFHAKTIEGYNLIAEMHEGIHVIDATRTIEEIHADVVATLKPYLTEKGYIS